MQFLKYLSYFMVLFFFVAGVYCIFSESVTEHLPGWRKYVMGVVLIAYGVLRGQRLKKQLTQTR